MNRLTEGEGMFSLGHFEFKGSVGPPNRDAQ